MYSLFFSVLKFYSIFFLYPLCFKPFIICLYFISTDDKTPINAGWVNSGYDQSDVVVPQPTAPKNSRGFSKYSGDSGVNSGLSDYISRMDPGRISSRRWRESIQDYRM